MQVVGAPPGDSSAGKKTNAGLVVGLTFLLVFILLAAVVCIYRSKRPPTRSQDITSQPPPQQQQQQEVIVQPVRAQELVQRPGRGQVQVQGVHNEEHGNEKKEVKPKREEGQHKGEKGGWKWVQAKEVGKEGVDDKVIRPKKRSREVKEQPRQDENDGRERKKGKEDVGEKHGEGVDRKKLPKKVVSPRKKPQKVLKEQRNSVGLPKKYTFDQLREMTNGFDPKNKLGGGGFGIVYRGTLENKTFVAVKCLKIEGRIDDFKNEMDALGRADHPNLVKLIGYGRDGLHRILMYEYMKNGSLDTGIFKPKPNRSLTWPEMKHVIQGIAQGLVYLHEQCKKTILHRDLKPPNVILDGNKNSKLCDFRIAKLLNKDQSRTWTDWAGSEGYMDPEAKKGSITDKVDVYSFGVVVLEIMFRKRYDDLVSLNRTNNTKQVKLHDLIMTLSEDMWKNRKEIMEFGKIALWSIKEKPEDRPPMSVVLADIRAI